MSIKLNTGIKPKSDSLDEPTVLSDDDRRQIIHCDIDAEADRAAAKFPNVGMLDGTRNGGMWLHQRTQAQDACDRAMREKKCTWAHVLLEEVFEAVCEENKKSLRAELVQIAAVCYRWIERLDSEAAT